MTKLAKERLPEPTLTPTAEQLLILDAVTTTETNLAVIARAGAAKTTTLVMIANAVPKHKEVLALAFNKKIAEELQVKLPLNAEARTLNSLGHRAFQAFLGRRISVTESKMSDIIKKLMPTFESQEQQFLWDNISEINEVIRTAKSEGYLPEKLHPSVKPLIMDSSFFDLFDFEVDPLIRQLTDEALRVSFRMAMQGEIDYNDQIYMSALMPCSFPRPDLTLVDEAQDLSGINHYILRKMVGKRRLIAVGDPYQAIYGFRGAREDSMDELVQAFDMKELFLTVCFRSDEAIVKNARWRAADMQWRPDAPLGEVRTLTEWKSELVLDGDAIICRNNAPIVGMALSLLRAGRHPQILGTDSLIAMLKTMKKFGPISTPISEARTALSEWEEKARKKYKSGNKVDDMVSTFNFFFEDATTLGEAISMFERIINSSGHIKLMTGHKSKGLEFDRVWFLNKFLLRKDGQDPNVRYVIETRARHSLFYVETDGWRG